MSDWAEIRAAVDKINPALVSLRDDVETLKTRDPLDDERFQKQADFVAKSMDELQQVQASVRAMQAVLDRPDFGKTSEEKREAEAENRRKVMEAFLRHGTLDPEAKHGNDKLQMEIRAMSTDVNPDGGYIVRPEWSDKVVRRVFETSPIMEVADVISGSAKSIEMLIDDDEHDANSVGEGASSGETDTAELGLKVIAAHKYDATPKTTTEMLQDAYFDVEAWSANKAARKIARKFNYDSVLGNGVNKARGFMALDAWAAAGTYERGKIEQRNLGTAAALNADGLIALQGDLIEDYQSEAIWAMHRTTYAAALQLKGADQYHFGPVLLRDGVAQPVMLGKPVRFFNDMATVAANALAVCYGNFREGYTVYDRMGIMVLRDPYSAHGFVSFYTTLRRGGDVTNYEALKIGKVAA